MKITLVAAGTRGDVQPYLALGRGLRKAGHPVCIATSDDFAEACAESDMEFRSTGPSVEQALQSPEWRKTVDSGNFIAIQARMRSEMKKAADRSAATLPDILADAELILAGPGGLAGAFSVAEKFGIPSVQAYVFPITPTAAFATPLLP